MSAFADLHVPGRPLLLPNAWDAVTGAVLAAEGFEAIGTTSLGVAAAAGKRDATGDAWPETLALAHKLARLGCHVTVDMEDGFSEDPQQVAHHAAQLDGIAGINLEDGHGDPARHAAKIAAVKAQTSLFVNARTDTHWLRRGDLQDAIDRCTAYTQAGADGVFVPGLPLEDIEAFVARVDAPLNVLYTPNANLAGRGVARISTGSLLFRASVGALRDHVRAVRAGRPIEAPPYDEVDGLSTKKAAR